MGHKSAQRPLWLRDILPALELLWFLDGLITLVITFLWPREGEKDHSEPKSPSWDISHRKVIDPQGVGQV